MPFAAEKVKAVCKRVPPFASSQEFSFWLDARFERVCSQEDCADADKLEALFCLVPSAVYSKLAEVALTPGITFTQIADRMKQFLCDEPTPNTALRTLRTLKQEGGETFRVFVDRLARLAKIAHPDSQVLAEREVCLQAAAGASCPKLKADLAYESPETLETLFDLYRKRKAAEECRVANVLAAVDERSRDDIANANANANSLDMKTVAARLDAIEKAIATLAERRRFTGKCFNCDQTGHVAKNCRQPKRESPEPRQQSRSYSDKKNL
jgi:hypothetical protein